MIKRWLIGMMVAVMFLSAPSAAVAATISEVDSAYQKAASFIYNKVSKPQIGSVGGEWAIIGLTRGGYNVPSSYLDGYADAVETYLKQNDGVLSDRKYTEYSRVIIGLTAAGFNPKSIGGYDITAPLGDFENTVKQGINGSIWALIAQNSGGYPIAQATEDLYIDDLLARKLSDGGFSLSGNKSQPSDPDITGMALQALAKYQDRTKVKEVIQNALSFLSKVQNDNGGYSYGSDTSSESVVQVIVALGELGIPIDDPRFVKNNKSLADNLLSFRNSDGSFNHTSGAGGDGMMATEQALYGLASCKRAANGQSSLYRMKTTAAVSPQTPVPTEVPKASLTGLPGKNADVKVMPTISGKVFSDMNGHENQKAVSQLSARGIISGRTENAFEPNGTMTRSEFASIVTRGLGLDAKNTMAFTDIPADAWYAGYVGTAHAYGIVSGVSQTEFQPNSLITGQEAAVMITRAARLCGMDTAIEADMANSILSRHDTAVNAADWAKSSIAFCIREEILFGTATDILKTISRGEVAEMLYRTLIAARLLSQ